MGWVYLILSALAALAVVVAYRPVRRGPAAVVCFALGWIPSELPVQTALVGLAVTVGFAAAGAMTSWPGRLGSALTVVSLLILARLAVVASRAGRVVDPAVDAVLAGARVPSTDPWTTRARWWELAIAVPFRPRDVVKVGDIDYWGDGNRRQRLDVFTRRSPAPVDAPVLVYVHGGAWVIGGDKRQQGLPMIYELVRRGWVCVAVNYRLSPKAAWPDHLVDCKRALAWVRAHIGEFGGNPGFVAVSGASAGGHLCSMLALTPGETRWQPGFEQVDTSVDACVPFYGVYDLRGDPDAMGIAGPGFLRFLENQIMKVKAADDPVLFEEASPDRWASEAAPPMLVLHGANDSLVPREVAERFVRRLRERSRAAVGYVELPRAQHAFDIFDSVRCRHSTRGVVRFLESVRLGARSERIAGGAGGRGPEAAADRPPG